MPYKPPRNKSAKKKTSPKKLSYQQIAMIVMAVILALAFLVFSVYSPKAKRQATNKPAAGEVNVPKFRKDGTVKILSDPAPITVDVEIADNEAARTQGLMYRYAMQENQGMLFIFPEEAPRAFWMKNTFIALDIIYISADKEIVSIQKDTRPQSTYSLPSEKPARYVLEVNAGFCDKFGVEPGDFVEF